MDANTCKNYERCPIFNGTLKGMEMTAKSYRKQFCQAGVSGWNNCKRFQVNAKTGKCPAGLLPNSSKSVEDIIASMN